MRPVKLVISGFGPYADRTELDMDSLGQSGLYLIAGKTGTGKTTIFDAISFALYGEASGRSRDSSMLRSKYADPDTPTEVELTFSYRGRIYTVRRNPEYERPAKRGSGVTKQIAGAVLTMPDGSVITRQRDVNEKIVSILGVDREHFSQIAMIAQGDFTELINADTKKRQEIFRKIFHTDKYSQLQDELRSRTLELQKEYQEADAKAKQLAAMISCGEGSAFAQALEEAKDSAQMTGLLALAEKIIEEDQLASDEAAAEIERLQKEIAEADRLQGIADQREKSLRQLEEDRERLSKELPECEEKRIKSEEAKKRDEEIGRLNNELAVLRDKLSDYDRLEELEASLKKDQTELKAQQELSENDAAKLDEARTAAASMEEELKSLADAGAELQKLLASAKEKEHQQKGLQDISADAADCLEAAEEAAAAEENARKALSDYDRKSQKYDAVNSAFIQYQAGQLAVKLKDGDPCPVCGSTVHPCPAVLPVDAPSDADVKKLRADCDKAQKILGKANEAAAGAGSKSAEKLKKLRSSAAELFAAAGPERAGEDMAADQIMERAAAELEISGHELRELRARITEAERKIKRKELIDSQLPEKKEMTEELSARIAEERERTAALNVTLSGCRKQIDELRGSLSFPGKAEAAGHISGLDARIRQIKKQQAAALQAYEEARSSCEKLKGGMERQEKALAEIPETDIGALHKKRQVLADSSRSLAQRKEKIGSRIETNRRYCDKITAGSADMQKLESESGMMRALSDTACGAISGKEKVTLETYIQMRFFDRIIERSNLRFMVMSSGQFELRRQSSAYNNRSQSGLELDVIDHHNGSERSVRSLSGGESFMAALSLALGLSDEIQAQSGGIQLDTMFIDEGFGTLDDEALEQAMNALATVAGGDRLVGIISHVDKLKERIDRQIVTTKDLTGKSSVDIISR